MAKAVQKKTRPAKRAKTERKPFRPIRWVGRVALRVISVFVAVVTLMIFLFAFVNPPITHTMWSERSRLGELDREWVAMDDIAPVMARSVVAAEDARFCQHWGFDVQAIRAAIAGGGSRGASTITQQVVKNVFLWQGRSWIRKALETLITPAVEAVWSKRRILEVYLNVAEMGEGIFGVKAAAQANFGVGPDQLSPRQAALIAAVLPAPRVRSPKQPTSNIKRKASRIMDGAATIRADGRSDCFED
ncbi:monofunctional biosynthetic peptidoglycan transglycosylase [Rhodobacteraceae bacterium M382]|nr:monofunctional biosynthetic peptidoglycan transglycosylase [Rhodobacteraceae bacterium M382]